MAIITTPGAGVSPYQSSDTDPTVLRAAADGTTVLANATTADATGPNTSVYVAGQAAVNSLITSGQSGVFQGANVNITLEEQNFNTTNQVTSTINYASGAAGSIQYNNGANGFAGSDYFTYTSGNVVTPGIRTDGYFYSNGAPFIGGGNAAIGNFVFTGDTMTTSNPTLYITANGDSNSSVTSIKNVSNAGNSDILLNRAQVAITSGTSNTWTFLADGGTIFPTLTTQRGDNPSGTITGQTLLFGNSLQEAIISTPDGTVGNEYSQRLVINPGAGNNFGEGGDIYLWAGRGGDGSGTGGDIKIRGGQGGANTQGGVGGDGGYIRIEAGDAASTGGTPGYIQITGGYSNTQGGYVSVTGGVGATVGGDVKIYGGYGQATGGNVNIWGGGSGNGQANEGHVNIQTGGNTWTFAADGNLTLPGNAFAVNYANGDPVVISGGAAGLPLANGTSNIDIATANGNVTITANGSPTWTFKSDGNLTLPTAGNIVGAVNIIGNGTGNVNVIANSRAWTFAADGNLVLPLAGNIVNYGNTWNFGYNGILTLPGNSRVAPVGANIEIQAAAGGYAEIVTSDGNSYVLVTTSGAQIVTSGVYSWNFNNVGNLTLPGNTFAVNYANGNPVSIANTGNVTFSSEIVIGTGTSNLISGLYLAPSSSSANANMYLRVRGNIVDEPTHIHFDTGNNQYYNQFIGDDNKYIQLANTGNIVINSNDAAGNSAQWTFGTDGNLTTPGVSGNITGANVISANVFTNLIGSGNVLIASSSNQTGPIATWTFDPVSDGTGNTVFPTGMHITSDGAGGTRMSQNSGTSNIGLRISAGNTNAFSSIGWSLDEIPGTGPVAVIAFNLPVSQNNAQIVTGNLSATNYRWTFDDGGNLTLPNGAVIKDNTGNSVAFGKTAGNTGQGISSVAIGYGAGLTNQGNQSVAIGENAGSNQGSTAVAIGQNAGGGVAHQNDDAVAIGHSAGEEDQGTQAIAIGLYAGQVAQGLNSIAIGGLAGQSAQGNNSIILNATGVAVNQTTANTFTVAPVRNDVANIAEIVFYNTTSKEITYGNTISVSGNITSANLFGNIYPQTGAILYVDGNRTDTYTPNGTINYPYTSIQDALDDAAPNTTISIAPGVYSENIVMPDLDGICIAGSSEMNTTIANAVTGHTFSWVPNSVTGAVVNKFCLQNIELTNGDTTGAYQTLYINATNVVYPNTFIGEEFDINTVDFEGSQSQSNATVYLNNVGAQNVYHSQVLGGAVLVINPGQFRSTAMVIGNTSDPHDFNVVYDGNLPRNGLGRNDITLAAGSAVFGNVNLNGHPIYQEDVDSVIIGNLNGANLSTFYASGRDYCPTILAYGQHGVIGRPGGSVNLTFPDPNVSGTSFNFVDFSNGHIQGVVNLTKSNLSPVSLRGYAIVQGQAQFDTTTANGISANGYVALDLRGANFNQSVLQATGAASIDRSTVTILAKSATTAGNLIAITPPLPTGATYATSVTPNSQSTVWVTSKTVGNLTVTASANTTVDITLTRNT